MLNLALLLTAIILELLGDASIRIGLRAGKPLHFLLGAALVICYGTVVSFPNWTFSRTMGVYIAVFFIVSQTIAKLMLHETPRLPTMLGGVLIVSGGLLILIWRPS